MKTMIKQFSKALADQKNESSKSGTAFGSKINSEITNVKATIKIFKNNAGLVNVSVFETGEVIMNFKKSPKEIELEIACVGK